MTTRSILIAGGTGVIGRRVVPQLVASGHRVTAVARSAAGRAALEGLGAIAVDVDLFDRSAVARVAREQDVVVNMATHVPPSRQALLPWAWRENSRVRRLGSANLAAAVLAGGASRLIQESFAPIYEGAGDQWIDLMQLTLRRIAVVGSLSLLAGNLLVAQSRDDLIRMRWIMR